VSEYSDMTRRPSENQADSLSPCRIRVNRTSPFSLRSRLARQVWSFVACTLFRASPVFLHCWRRLLLRLFGAHVGRKVRIQPSVRIWAPWNLDLGDYCSIGARVDCYSVSNVRIGRCATVSQDCVLCTASHDHRSLDLPVITEDIQIGPYAWICAGVFIMPGVVIGERTVVGVRSVVFRDLPPGMVAWGCPCRVQGSRSLDKDERLA